LRGREGRARGRYKGLGLSTEVKRSEGEGVLGDETLARHSDQCCTQENYHMNSRNAEQVDGRCCSDDPGARVETASEL
jgi:hypothetical protein